VKAGGIAGERAFAKIRAVLGESRANALIERTLATIQVSSLETVDDCYRFGNALTREGGLTEAIGRAIMVQALLAGAKAA
jgi:hypothetical protein